MINMTMEFGWSTKNMHRYNEVGFEDDQNPISLYLRKSDLGEDAPKTIEVSIKIQN